LVKAGQYTDTLQTISGCDSIITLNLAVNSKYNQTLEAAICDGDSYLFNGKPLVKAGKYTDTLQTVNGCDSIITLNLTVNPLPDEPVVTVVGDTLTAPAANGYQWYLDNAVLNGKTAQTLVIAKSGNYKVEVFNGFGCSSQSAGYAVIYSAVSVYSSPGFDFKVFPNPNNGMFTVEMETTADEPVWVELLSLNGESIIRKQMPGQVGKSSFLFGKQGLAQGVYTLRVQAGEQAVAQKLVVN